MTKRHPGRPKRTDRSDCVVEGCVKEETRRGLCGTHYMAWRRGQLNENGMEKRPKLRVSSYGPEAHCTVEGCARRPKVRGLCYTHSVRFKKGQDLVPEIKTHYQKDAKSYVVCSVLNCERRAFSKSMCGTHASQRQSGLIDDVGNKLRDKKKPGPPRKADQYIVDGYILVWAPEGHPHPQASGRILEHRLVMEGQLGRYLEEWELVHHEDGNRQNNEIDNLKLLDGRAKKSEGHPPGSNFDYLVALQVVAQSDRTPFHIVRSIRKLQRRQAA